MSVFRELSRELLPEGLWSRSKTLPCRGAADGTNVCGSRLAINGWALASLNVWDSVRCRGLSRMHGVPNM